MKRLRARLARFIRSLTSCMRRSEYVLEDIESERVDAELNWNIDPSYLVAVAGVLIGAWSLFCT